MIQSQLQQPRSRTPKRAIRWALFSVVAAQLVACSMFSSSKKPEPKPLEANVALFAASQAWTANVGSLGNIQLTPVVNGDAVTLATASGNVVSLQASTGTELWRVKLDTNILAGVGGDGTTFAVISNQNEVIAMRDGKELWRHALPARSFTPPFVAGERVFVITADRALLALDADNGALIWDRPGSDGENLSLRESLLLTSVGNTLVAGFSGRVVGINPDTGSLRWESSVAIPRGINDIERLVDIVGHYSRVGNNICVQAFQTAIGCVNASLGDTTWTQKVNGAVGVGGDENYVYSVDVTGRMQAWDRISGTQQWLSDRLQYRDLTAPLQIGRAVAVGDAGGLLHLIERADGSPLNRFQTNSSGIRVAPIYAGNTLIAVTNNGTVFGYRPD